MRTQSFVRRTRLGVSAEEAFRWHFRPGAFARLLPPWEKARIEEQSGGIRDGGRVVLRVPLGPVRCTWVAEHRDFEEGRSFRDVQITGPFAFWDHCHRFEPDGADDCFLEDRVEYALPLGRLGRWLAGSMVRGRLERTFAYRQRTTADDLAAHTRARCPAMHVIVSGSTGLVGSALVPFLTTGGHRVTRLIRTIPAAGEDAVRWDPATGSVDAAALEGADAVVHLAGENIAGGRWTDEKKARIRDSRVRGTRILCDALAKLARPPRVLVAASATGYYGDRGDEILTEDSTPGHNFLAEVCRDWERATDPAAARGIRIVNLRFGVIFSPAGGALAKMLTPFRMGVGGRIGSGRQWLSWIALDDAVGAAHHALTSESVRGPVNAVAPGSVTNLQFTKGLGRVLGRPTILPMSSFATRLAFGQMADELLLASARVEPTRLLQTGYAFRHPELESALRHLLGKPGSSA